MISKQRIHQKIEDFKIEKSKLVELLTECKEGVSALNDFLAIYYRISDILSLLSEDEKSEVSYDLDSALNEFFIGVNSEYPKYHGLMCSFGNISIALLVFRDYFIENSEFTLLDFQQSEHFKKIINEEEKAAAVAFMNPESQNRAIEMDGEIHSVPTAKVTTFIDNSGNKFIFKYAPTQGGMEFVLLGGSEKATTKLLQKLRTAVIRSKYILGKTIELSEEGINIVPIKEHEIPALDEELESRLNREILSIYDKTLEFTKHNLALRRSIILAGPPGTGKTSYCRYLAHKLKGRVTTLWVTAKSINRAQDVAKVFETARILSPVLLIMEDLDLIAGTRNSLAAQYHGNSSNPLGEMLNQLDGLTRNDSLVLVGTTNEIKALDSALSDRPGRFDRIFSVGVPSNEMALRISEGFLIKHNIDESLIEALDLTCVIGNNFSGAQIVEVLKGALLDSINSGVGINTFMLKRSVKDLNDQRAMILGTSQAKKPEDFN